MKASKSIYAVLVTLSFSITALGSAFSDLKDRFESLPKGQVSYDIIKGGTLVSCVNSFKEDLVETVLFVSKKNTDRTIGTLLFSPNIKNANDFIASVNSINNLFDSLFNRNRFESFQDPNLGLVVKHTYSSMDNGIWSERFLHIYSFTFRSDNGVIYVKRERPADPNTDEQTVICSFEKHLGDLPSSPKNQICLDPIRDMAVPCKR